MPIAVVDVVVETGGGSSGTLNASGGAISLEVGVNAAHAATRIGTRTEFEIRKVSKRGTVLHEFEKVVGVTITRTVGSEPEVAFGIPKWHPDAAVLSGLDEIQVYRDGDLKAWAVVLGDSRSSSDGAIPITALGLWWYFRRRYFGTADRRNSIRNGDFEFGAADGTAAIIPGWRAFGDGTFIHYRADTKPDGSLPDPLEGTKAVATFATAGRNAYLESSWSYHTEHPPGQRVTVAAWFYPAAFVGPAGFGLGIYLARVVAGVPVVSSFAELTAPRAGRWTRLETSLIVPPHQNGRIVARLYAPGGVGAWDAARSAFMESTSTPFGEPLDQAVIAGRVVSRGQHDRGKSDLRIGTRTPATGVLRERSWQHVDHEWLNSAVDGMALMSDGFEYRVDVTPKTRTFRTFFPRIGHDRRFDSAARLEFGANVTSYTEARDWSTISTSVIASSTSQGPAREEGAAMDLDRYDGLVLEERQDAPDDVTIGELDTYAEGILADVGDPAVPLDVTIVDRDLIDLLEEPGDLVRLVIHDGPGVSIDDHYRVVRTVLTSAKMVLTLNPWIED